MGFVFIMSKLLKKKKINKLVDLKKRVKFLVEDEQQEYKTMFYNRESKKNQNNTGLLMFFT